MKNKKEAFYTEIGQKLKEIREKTGISKSGIGKDSGVDRKYVSFFERGLKLPAAKYLKYLHDSHNVNLNFVFCGERNDSRLGYNDKMVDLLRNEGVDTLLCLMADIPHVYHSVLTFFAEYYMNNEDLIDRYYAKKEKKSQLCDSLYT